MSGRNQNTTKTTMDMVSIYTARGWVSGTGVGDMSGSLIKSTDMKTTVTYGSGSLGLPTGSFRVTLGADNRYAQVMSWHATISVSGTSVRSNGLATAMDYEVMQYGHDATNGTFDLGFVTPLLTGSAGINVNTGHHIGAIPADKINTASPACEWFLTAIVRDTKRRV